MAVECTVRKYRTDDRTAVRRICCDTGFMGDPIETLFSDRAAFADFFTRYYTDSEPEHCWVAEKDGEVVGYLLTCLRYRRYPWLQAWNVARAVPRVIGRAVTLRYRRQDYRFLGWFVLRSARETPRAPRRMGHFHFNVLSGSRASWAGRYLLMALLEFLDSTGIHRIYGQMQVYDSRRGARVFERFGFHVFDQRRITKFERFGKKNVYVATIVRSLEESTTPGGVVS